MRTGLTPYISTHFFGPVISPVISTGDRQKIPRVIVGHGGKLPQHLGGQWGGLGEGPLGHVWRAFVAGTGDAILGPLGPY